MMMMPTANATGRPTCIAASRTDAVRNYSHVHPDGDYDGDQLLEIFEFAFDRDPTKADSADVITSWVEDGFLVLRHPLVKVDYISVIGEQSINLQSWAPCENVRSVLSQDFPQRVIAREWRIPLDGPEQFLRISARPN